MGGPTEQKTNTVFLPPGEGRQTFAPSPLAWIVENLEPGQDGILESIVGPSILRIKSQIFYDSDSGTTRVFEVTGSRRSLMLHKDNHMQKRIVDLVEIE